MKVKGDGMKTRIMIGATFNVWNKYRGDGNLIYYYKPDKKYLHE